MRSQFHTLILPCVAAAMLLFGHAHGAAAVEGITPDAIKIGMVNAQSGGQSANGKAMHQGAAAALAEVNAAGGVHGRKIELFLADDGYDPQRTVAESMTLIEKGKVFALLGYLGTSTTNAMLPVLSALNIPLISVRSGAASFRTPLIRQIFNTRVSYDGETEALVAQLVAGGARRIGVVYQFDGLGLAILSGVTKALQRRGMQMAGSGSYQRNSLALNEAVGEMVRARPDAIVVGGVYTAVAAFTSQLKATGVAPQLAVGSYVNTIALIKQMGEDADGMLISQVLPDLNDVLNGAVQSCRHTLLKYAQVELDYSNFEGCVAARALVAGLEAAGPAPTRDGLIAAMESLKRLDLGGFTLSFSPTDHQGSSQVYMTQVRGGQAMQMR